jgi:20S proteasome alpha/beta subunit
MIWQDPQEIGHNMTLQVALIGKDGFVIASDRKTVNEVSVRRTAETTKVIVSDKADIVCAFSGTHIVSSVAKHVVATLNSYGDRDDIETRLEKAVLEKFELYDGPVREHLAKAGRAMIVAAYNEKNGRARLWEVIFTGHPFVNSFLDKAIGGDSINTAIFLVERYYNGKETPVEDLTILAVHTILEGHALNPLMVGGVDVVVSQHGEKPRLLTDEEVRSLRERSTEIHNKVGTLLSANQ